MYAWIWRALPGRLPLRVALAVLLGCAVVALLFLVVFPWAEQALPFTSVTVDGSPAP